MSSSPRPRKSATGFTLIELLVVIAIIAILAAILFPVFAQAREKARQTSCISNNKEVGLAIIQYVQDYDENFPSGWYPATAAFAEIAVGSTVGLGWANETYPYMKNSQVYKCPDDITQPVPASGAIGPEYPVSYVFNANIPLGYPTLAGMTAPASTVLGCEGDGLLAQIPTTAESLTYPTTWPTTASGSTDGLNFVESAPKQAGAIANGAYLDTGYLGGHAPLGGLTNPATIIWRTTSTNGGRHTDGSVYICGDGHAKWLKPPAVSCGPAATSSANAATSTTSAGTSAMSGFQLTFSPN